MVITKRLRLRKFKEDDLEELYDYRNNYSCNKYQRNGYAFEILSNLIEVIHERYKNYEIVAMTDKENESSINLLKKHCIRKKS